MTRDHGRDETPPSAVVVWSQLEDQDAEVLVHPLLLVREAASSLLGQLRLDGVLDPEASIAERIEQIRDRERTLGESDLHVPAAPVRVVLRREVLLAKRAPVLLGALDRIPDRMRPSEEDVAVVGQQRARFAEGSDGIGGIAERLQEHDAIEPATLELTNRPDLGKVSSDDRIVEHSQKDLTRFGPL